MIKILIMRNRYILLVGFLVLLFTSCDEREIQIFNDRNELFFEKYFVNEMAPGTESADSTFASFFFYPDGTKDIEAEIVVLLSGKELEQDQHFQLKVIEEETTVNADEYTLDDFYIFHANTIDEESTDIRDVIKIKFHRSDRVEELQNGVRLVLELVPNDFFSLGQVERIRTKIILTTAAAQPQWWTSEVEKSLLGKYSDKKYRYFLNEIDKKAEMSEDLIKNHPDQAIKLAIEFKEWLAKQNPAITEDDGSLMEVMI